MFGENHPMFGKQPSEETKQKMSQRMSGETHPMFGKTGETHPMFGKTGENNPNFGKKHSEETKQKIKNSTRKRMKKVERVDPETR